MVYHVKQVSFLQQFFSRLMKPKLRFYMQATLKKKMSLTPALIDLHELYGERDSKANSEKFFWQ